MTTGQLDFRCAAASEDRAESLSGTASTVRAFLLVEHPGPWGVDALRDARLPDGVGAALGEKARAMRGKVLLARRPGGLSKGAGTTEGVRVVAAFAHHEQPWLETGTLASYDEVLDLDLAALGEGRSLGLTPRTDPVFAVCTHGRHDACCAERGRPVAAALAEVFPEETWECSHLGGDRYSGNLVVLPHGLYYGRLEEASARELARLHHHGEVHLPHLRGRSAYALPVQAAENALRRHVDEHRLDAVRFVSRRVDGQRADVVFSVAGRRYAVVVTTSHTEDVHRLTCRAEREGAATRHVVSEIRHLP